MTYQFSSVFASYILDFIATKRAAGWLYDSAEYYLYNFDKYCLLSASSGILSRDLVLGWATARPGEKPQTQRTRISPIRELGKYMQTLGVSDAFVLPTALHRKMDRHVPYFFTDEELALFFSVCDKLKPHGGMRARHLVLPVFFRLLYCCGLRTCEARTLRREHINLQSRSMDIVGSKWHRSRRIPLPQDILMLLRKYDTSVSKIYPGRIYFFPTTRLECYKRNNISLIFGKIWKAAGLKQGCGSKPRAYDFRHHFALSNLNRWIAADLDINSKLPYLSRYMGHASLQSTDYYLHLVPDFFQTFSDKVRITETVLPEVDYDAD